MLVGKPERKRQFGRHARRLEDNIRMDLREIGWGGVDWIHLTEVTDQWRALVNTVMNLRVPRKGGWIYWLAEWLSVSQDGLCFMEEVHRNVVICGVVFQRAMLWFRSYDRPIVLYSALKSRKTLWGRTLLKESPTAQYFSKMLATLQFRIFLSFCLLSKNFKLERTQLQFYLLHAEFLRNQ